MRLTDETGAIVDVVKRPNGKSMLIVETPFPWRNGGDPPIHRQPDHALLRPYAKMLDENKPIVGAVQFTMIQVPGEPVPRVLYGTALRPVTSEDGVVPALPGNLFIFPGFTAGTRFSRRGRAHRFHHMSIRGLDNGKIRAYAHARPNGDEESRTAERSGGSSWPGDSSFVYLGEIGVDSPASLDRAGTAIAPISDELATGASKRGFFFPDPRVRNHEVHDVGAPSDLNAAHYWTVFLAARRMPTSQDELKILRFLKAYVEPQVTKVRIDGAEAYDGDVGVHARAVDLTWAGPARFPWLVTLSAVLPGRLSGGCHAVSFASPLPIEQMKNVVL